MADGRKNNRGHKGKAGRKPKADEIKLIEQMDAIAAPAKVWRALFDRCQEGDTQAIKCWLSYRFGMPKQTIDLDIKERPIFTPIDLDVPTDNSTS